MIPVADRVLLQVLRTKVDRVLQNGDLNAPDLKHTMYDASSGGRTQTGMHAVSNPEYVWSMYLLLTTE